MSDSISREEHEEFRKRIEAEDNRQNRRIELLEKSVEQFTNLTTWNPCSKSRNSRANDWKSWKAETVRSGET